ncbi:alanine--tRNA ligase [Enhydrobacter sp.]|jgi:alanyl-tRNA synthetase|uniref:alanine--tRNA ligase n=1 Tax=Enhydrobacter sp. TaxID=1894999 RepID=UPI0026118910|nr:alanine--tRNA ligase [Enhydrobacter sp.]WIM13532.1 MAG: Alanyl-tRNA synthetase [Enhydrobacter sp.]
MASVSDVRRTFLEYFRENGHEVVSSSPLVPRNDPTLMFTNAGMVQFKNVFTGMEKRPYARATTSQKCVRAGGKHNDLENVGYTARHHTFFEMLGNFSFGDYFKELAIELAWNLITREFGLRPDRLLVTVFSEDDEAARYWRKVTGFPDSRIIRIPTSDNFWAMGDTGPCGPCSEIFYDHGEGIPGGPPGSPDEDGDRFIEIWNLVFMQFEQQTPELRVPLPKPSIDTGMGLERIAAVLQGKHNNYDIDLFRALIEAVAHETGVDPDGPQGASHKVIADHLRATSFLIADGVLPSNEGRGYVLRRIMRRAMRHAHILGATEPMVYKLVPTLVHEMGDAYPELGRAQALITETLKLEETRFKKTLGTGLKLLEDESRNLSAGGMLKGDIAFKLYDTYGFPLDLTQDVLRARDITVDTTGFEKAMDEQRAKARAAWAGSGEAASEAIWFDVRQKVGATEFLGYDTERAEGKVTAIIVEGKEVPSLKAGQTGWLVVNQTPFYAESGGQLGDTGRFVGPAGEAEIADVQKMVGDLHAHHAKVAKGEIKMGDEVVMTVDAIRRAQLRAHHSATHLLHEALRRHLGTHVTQKGSLVAPDRLRFDISHTKPISQEELRRIEDEVNERIRLNTPVDTRLMTPEEAIAAGAMALFGEKYGDEVRVLSMGGVDGERYSIELCGGTHAQRTGDIGLFRIVGEGAVSAGVRRIEALAGAAAEEYVRHQLDLLNQAASALKVRPEDLPARLAALMDGQRRVERELSDARKALALAGGGGGAGSAADDVRQVGKVKMIGRVLNGVPGKDLKGMADEFKKKLGSGVVALIGVDDGKASAVVGVTDDLSKTLSAVELVKAGVAALGGKGGGGRPDMAQGGGPDATKAPDALKAIEAALGGMA